MNEKEKMLSGILYDSTIEELSNERLNAKKLCYERKKFYPNY